MSNIFDRLECKWKWTSQKFKNDKVCEFILNFSLHCGICTFPTVLQIHGISMGTEMGKSRNIFRCVGIIKKNKSQIIQFKNMLTMN